MLAARGRVTDVRGTQVVVATLQGSPGAQAFDALVVKGAQATVVAITRHLWFMLTTGARVTGVRGAGLSVVAIDRWTDAFAPDALFTLGTGIEIVTGTFNGIENAARAGKAGIHRADLVVITHQRNTLALSQLAGVLVGTGLTVITGGVIGGGALEAGTVVALGKLAGVQHTDLAFAIFVLRAFHHVGDVGFVGAGIAGILTRVNRDHPDRTGHP